MLLKQMEMEIWQAEKLWSMQFKGMKRITVVVFLFFRQREVKEIPLEEFMNVNVSLQVCLYFCGHKPLFLTFIWHSEDRASWYILIMKPTRCTISQIYFDKELYIFRTDLLSIIRSLVLYTQQNLCDIYLLLCVQR
jgi:hypothetical protein